jgi:hypothetical protein
MTLWHLLVFVSGAAALGSAWTAAQFAKRVGNTEFVLAVVAAVIIAITCAMVLEILGRQLFHKVVAAPDSREGGRPVIDIAVRTMYFFAMAWCVASGFLGYWLTSLLVNSLQ